MITEHELQAMEARAMRIGEECYRLPQLKLIAEVRRLQKRDAGTGAALIKQGERLATQVAHLEAKLEEQRESSDLGWARVSFLQKTLSERDATIEKLGEHIKSCRSALEDLTR